jgi:hypothetical protein
MRTAPTRAFLFIAALGAFACDAPRTEVLIVVDTDLRVPDELDEVRVDLIGPNGEIRRSEGSLTHQDELPRTVGVVDRANGARMVRVTVTGLHAGANVVQRRAAFAFVPHETRMLRVTLLARCVGVVCPSDQSCGEDGCRSMQVGPEEIARYDPDAVKHLDAGVDGGSDGSVDGGCVIAKEACNELDDDCDGAVDEGFDLATDVANCGACGDACVSSPDNASSACMAGACELACDMGFADCDGDGSNGCEAVLSGPDHCGACEVACTGGTPFCEEGAAGFACVAACSAGSSACSGACVDITSDPLRCGDCTTVCEAPPNAVAACMAGSCDFECDAGHADCDGDPTNGCESTLRELDNCGRCGAACASPGAVTSCATGTCQTLGCEPLRGDCDGDATNGCEEDLSSSLAHCGACATSCPSGVANAGVACIDGACRLTCNAGFANCNVDVADGCEQSLAATSACGMCGVGCADPTPFCEAVSSGGHACTDGCGASVLCGASCVDTASDPLHCGGCDVACPTAVNATPTCTAGTCALACNAGFGDCDMEAGTGCETSTATDVTSCGSCGNACPIPPHADATCSMGACGYRCRPGHADCNGMASDGCEVDLGSDVDHCGACENRCAVSGSIAAIACVSGACEITACTTPAADCDESYANGCEIDTDVNKHHCGGCGIQCHGPERCCGGTCHPRGGCP